MGYLCILWHLHQPYYSDIEENINNTSVIFFRTIQNYYPMAFLIEKFENVKINFNITPSLLKQIKLISEGKIEDIFFNIFNYDLSPDEILNFYNEFPNTYKNSNKTLNILKEKIEENFYNKSDLFDFKFLLHLISFNPLIVDEEIDYLREKGRNFNEDDLEILLDKERKIFKNIIPLYKKLQEQKKIEISSSPFYHPILPLIYDTEIMRKTKTNLSYPDIRFNYPEDAEKQIERGIKFYKEIFERYPSGIWPSEGALSDEIIELFCKYNIKWTATDENLLFETLKDNDRRNLYKNYKYKDKIFIFFRDHYLSDLIGFSYQNMDEEKAAFDLIGKIKKIFDEKPDGIVTIILDGENPWDYYREKGIKFLKTLYKLLEEDKNIKTLTFTDAIEICKEYKIIEGISPGSWMGTNFDNWIGKENANKAWKFLKDAREKIEKVKNRDEIVYELILNAEGSDWFWWYSIEADRRIKEKFDRYFKNNLIKIYKKLNENIPDEIEGKIIFEEKIPFIKVKIDGKITDFYEWYQSIEIKIEDLWRVFKPFNLPLKKIFYGYDEKNLYLRFDFEKKIENLKIIFDGEVYDINKKDFYEKKWEYVMDEILEVRIERKENKNKSEIQFEIKIDDYDFLLPPDSKILIIFKEPEWIV